MLNINISSFCLIQYCEDANYSYIFYDNADKKVKCLKS